MEICQYLSGGLCGLCLRQQLLPRDQRRACAGLPPSRAALWFQPAAGILYNGICLLFLLAAWYPATHSVRMMIEDQNFAQTWYIFWILPMLFIGLNIFMVPTCHDTLYTGRILQIYIVLSLILLVILVLFYSMFLLMANSLNRNARLQQANHFLLLQQTRYDSLRTAIEEARQARTLICAIIFSVVRSGRTGRHRKNKNVSRRCYE